MQLTRTVEYNLRGITLLVSIYYAGWHWREVGNKIVFRFILHNLHI